MMSLHNVLQFDSVYKACGSCFTRGNTLSLLSLECTLNVLLSIFDVFPTDLYLLYDTFPVS